MRRRWQGDDGVTSIEFVTLLPLLLAVGAMVWQLLVAGAAASAIENAARDASRVAGTGADAGAVTARASQSLPSWLRGGGVQVARPGGTAVEVTVPIPLVFPGLTWDDLAITRRAELPDTT